MSKLSVLYAAVTKAAGKVEAAQGELMRSALSATLATMVLKRESARGAVETVENTAKLAKGSLSKVAKVAGNLADQFRSTLPEDQSESVVCDAAVTFAKGVQVSKVYTESTAPAREKREQAAADREAEASRDAAAKGVSVPSLKAEKLAARAIATLGAAARNGDMGAAACLARIIDAARAEGEKVAEHFATAQAA
jgi:hypothetical protein